MVVGGWVAMVAVVAMVAAVTEVGWVDKKDEYVYNFGVRYRRKASR